MSALRAVAVSAYRATVDHTPVRDAYSALAAQYIALVDDDKEAAWAERSFIERHLVAGAPPGPVFDLGCGPGHWSAHLDSLGQDVTGVDLVPEFIDHARATHPGPTFRLGSMTAADLPAGSAAGVLSWYSTIHASPTQLDGVLAAFRRLLADSGMLVVGFFDSADDVAVFDHAVIEAYRWPAEVFAERLAGAGLREVERLRLRRARRPDRRYAAIAARAT